MTEQQPYDVVARYPGFELRRYPEHVVAEIEVEGSFEKAGNAAFRPLVSYISGANESRSGLAMTAPVVQRPDDEAAEGASGRHTVAFVLPTSVVSGRAPTPTDPRVHVQVVPEGTAAVVAYSGRWSEESYRRKVADLLTVLGDAGIEVAGPASFARFDPPWKPWFARRNEIVVPVSVPSADSDA